MHRETDALSSASHASGSDILCAPETAALISQQRVAIGGPLAHKRASERERHRVLKHSLSSAGERGSASMLVQHAALSFPSASCFCQIPLTSLIPTSEALRFPFIWQKAGVGALLSGREAEIFSRMLSERRIWLQLQLEASGGRLANQEPLKAPRISGGSLSGLFACALMRRPPVVMATILYTSAEHEYWPSRSHWSKAEKFTLCPTLHNSCECEFSQAKNNKSH